MEHGIECPHCGGGVAEHADGLPSYHPMHESYPNLYGRICPNCKRLIEPLEPPLFVQRNRDKLKLLREQARKALRDQLAGRRGGTHGDTQK